MRYNREITGSTYCTDRDSSKYHMWDKRGRAYMCDCARDYHITHKLRVGVRNRYDRGRYGSERFFPWRLSYLGRDNENS